MDFNSITIEREKEVVTKFKEHGKGVQMGRYQNGDVATWTELIDQKLWSESHIKTKMLELARTINTICNDEFLGNLDVAFTATTERDEKIEFTHLELYIFLRAALRYRRETTEYKAKKERKAELEKFLSENKSRRDRLTEAQAELQALEGQLD